jgi:DNA topoisomerase-1
MPGLTAKVFRTYNASITLEKELPSTEAMKGLSIQEKLVMYNAANRQVAILCNHQKTVSKAAEVMFENLNEKLENLNSQRRELVSWLELAKKKKASKIPLKKDDSKLVDKIVAAVKDAQARKETARTDEEKLSAAADLEVAKAKQKEDQKRRFQQKHMYKQEPTAAALEAKIAKWGVDIRKMETDIRNRDENKDVALGTSKINYMDPRISVAWCKRNEVPIDKVFAKTLREKFNWACAVPPDWKFEPH